MSKKLTFSQLALMDWLLEPGNPGRFLTKFINNTTPHPLVYHEVAGRNEAGKLLCKDVSTNVGGGTNEERAIRDREIADFTRRMGGTLSFDTTGLERAGYLNRATYFTNAESWNKFASQFGNLNLSGDALFRLTPKGREWYSAEGRDLYRAQLEKRNARRQASERTILICAEFTMRPTLSDELKKKVPDGVTLPLPMRKIMRPFATATVIGETEKRISIENVVMLQDWKRYNYAADHQIRWPIQGREPNLYVEPSAVMVNHADAEITGKLSEIDLDDVDAFNRAAEYHMAQILPHLIEMNLRLKQNALARDEMMQEAIDRFTNANERKPR